MLGLSIREKLQQLIYKICLDNLTQLEDDTRELFNNTANLSDEEIQEEYSIKRNEYLDNVSSQTIQTVSSISTKAQANFYILTLNPSDCGYDIELSGIMAGKVYAFCYYAMTNKIAKPEDCTKLNHIQYHLIDKIFQKIETEHLL